MRSRDLTPRGCHEQFGEEGPHNGVTLISAGRPPAVQLSAAVQPPAPQIDPFTFIVDWAERIVIPPSLGAPFPTAPTVTPIPRPRLSAAPSRTTTTQSSRGSNTGSSSRRTQSGGF